MTLVDKARDLRRIFARAFDEGVEEARAAEAIRAGHRAAEKAVDPETVEARMSRIVAARKAWAEAQWEYAEALAQRRDDHPEELGRFSDGSPWSHYIDVRDEHLDHLAYMLKLSYEVTDYHFSTTEQQALKWALEQLEWRLPPKVKEPDPPAKCRWCDGTGWVDYPHHSVACGYCKGTGRKVVKEPEPTPAELAQIEDRERIQAQVALNKVVRHLGYDAWDDDDIPRDAIATDDTLG